MTLEAARSQLAKTPARAAAVDPSEARPPRASATAHPPVAELVAEMVAESRQAQGLPRYIEHMPTLERIAILLFSDEPGVVVEDDSSRVEPITSADAGWRNGDVVEHGGDDRSAAVQ